MILKEHRILTAFIGVVKSCPSKAAIRPSQSSPSAQRNRKPLRTSKNQSVFTAFSHANILSRHEIGFLESTYLTELPDCLSLQRTSVLHSFPQHGLFNDQIWLWHQAYDRTQICFLFGQEMQVRRIFAG